VHGGITGISTKTECGNSYATPYKQAMNMGMIPEDNGFK
jgi:hypothetical protein